MATTPEDAAYYKRVLHELIDLGADLARIVHAQAKCRTEAATAARPPIQAANDRFPDPAVAFDRIARTVRRTILLVQKLDEPAPARDQDPHRHRIASRKRILRAVEDTIDIEARPEHRPALQAELLDRLDAPDLEDDIDTRPIQEIIDDICRDLQLAFPTQRWKRRTPTDIQTLRTRAAKIPKTWTTTPQPPPPHKKPAPPPRMRNYRITDSG